MGLATRVSVIELMGYREWTESLGPDREWLIQVTQARVYAAAQEEAARHGGFVLPTRFDYMIVLSSGMGRMELARVLSAAGEYSPVPVRMGSACSTSPLAAEEAAFNLLQEARPGGVEFEECRDTEAAAVAHIDLNNVTGLTLRIGAYKAFKIIIEIVERISSTLAQAGALTQYLGGDNLVAAMPVDPPEAAKELTLKAVSLSDLKAGVGVSKTYRRALALAADALHAIRTGEVNGKVYVKVG